MQADEKFRELEFTRRSGECADKGFEAMLEVARPGVTEQELVAYCESGMVRAGAEPGNFILLGSAPGQSGELFHLE